MSVDRIIVKVAVPTPNRILFDYCIDSTLNNDKKRGPLKPGSRVIVPFGKRSIVGIIVSLVTQSTVENKKLKLTIDIDLQTYGDSLMQNKYGSIIAIEPKSGEILALVNSPGYDPNLLVGRDRSNIYKILNNIPENYLSIYF